jgi:hypothetical protein
LTLQLGLQHKTTDRETIQTSRILVEYAVMKHQLEATVFTIPKKTPHIL